MRTKTSKKNKYKIGEGVRGNTADRNVRWRLKSPEKEERKKVVIY